MDVEKKEVFYDNLTYIYLEMPKFKKTEEELESLVDKWLYALKNLPHLLERPKALQERIFKKFFDVAEVAALTKEDYFRYVESEQVYYDLDGAFRTASKKGYTQGKRKGLAEGCAEGMAEGMAEGIAKGIAEGRAEVAKKMKSMGIFVDDIVQATGLTLGEIELIREEKNDFFLPFGNFYVTLSLDS